MGHNIQFHPDFDVGPTLYKCYTNVLCLLDPHRRRHIAANTWAHPHGTTYPLVSLAHHYMTTVTQHHSGANSVQVQHTQNVGPMLSQCWASVVDGGPTLVQHRANVSRLLCSSAGKEISSILISPKR